MTSGVHGRYRCGLTTELSSQTTNIQNCQAQINLVLKYIESAPFNKEGTLDEPLTALRDFQKDLRYPIIGQIASTAKKNRRSAVLKALQKIQRVFLQHKPKPETPPYLAASHCVAHLLGSVEFPVSFTKCNWRDFKKAFDALGGGIPKDDKRASKKFNEFKTHLEQLIERGQEEAAMGTRLSECLIHLKKLDDNTPKQHIRAKGILYAILKALESSILSLSLTVENWQAFQNSVRNALTIEIKTPEESAGENPARPEEADVKNRKDPKDSSAKQNLREAARAILNGVKVGVRELGRNLREEPAVQHLIKEATEELLDKAKELAKLVEQKLR